MHPPCAGMPGVEEPAAPFLSIRLTAATKSLS
jgi:hypothetical protein